MPASEPFIVWSDALVVDEGVIDHQHRQLVQAINELHQRVAAGSAQMPELLSFLALYADLHFAEEEQWMVRAGYHEAQHHRELHRGFISRVERFRLDHEGGQPVSQSMLEFLRGWLVSHIQGADRAFAPVLNAYRQRTLITAEF